MQPPKLVMRRTCGPPFACAGAGGAAATGAGAGAGGRGGGWRPAPARGVAEDKESPWCDGVIIGGRGWRPLPALALDRGVEEDEEESPWCDDVIVGGRGRRRTRRWRRGRRRRSRIVAFPRAAASYATLVAALARVAPNLFVPCVPHPTLKYKLPQDDLDSLISVSSDDDVDHLMDELDRLQDLNTNVAKPTRLRAFLFAPQPPGGAFGSILSVTGGEASCDQWFVDALNAPAPHPIERGRSESSSIISDLPDYLFGLDNASDERSPGTTATRNKSDNETPHGEDDELASAPGEYESSYASSMGSSWPAPPPPYMGQPVYYFPVAPVHYPPVQGGGYMPRPVYHMVGGGGSEAPVHPHAAAGGTGGAYGVPHPMQPFPPMMYAPPRQVVYAADGKQPAEGGVHSSPESSP